MTARSTILLVDNMLNSIIETALNIRHAVRTHRDQMGDYRCWVDDLVLYHRVLPELQAATPELPCRDEFHRRCVLFFESRQNPHEIPRIIPLDSSREPLVLKYDPALDHDLDELPIQNIDQEINQWHVLIRSHRDAGDSRTFEHDRMLYQNLPEKLEAVTQLPPRELFLGRGCPAYNQFCQSHPEEFSKAEWSAKRDS